ncbi:MAG: TetR/AcrR family transcriptional regulator [Lachnospiraceae bacterium]|nr:TetR/AcrR family transcriptional regulator [Lachnospiraceae bacterium]
MNEKFFSLKKEKQDKMINGAMQVFSLYGYRHASTDEMVRVCGVSKGLWFHYFENKPGLYSFVASYGLKYAMLELSMKPFTPGMDYFRLRYEIEACKMDMMEKYPYLPLFLNSIVREEDPDVAELIREPRQKYAEQLSGIMMQADYSALRNKEDYLLLIDMLDYTIEALMADGYRSPVFAPGRYLMEVQKHINAMQALL